MILNYLKAAAWLSKQEPCISGRGGHNRLYFVTCTLVVHFDLTREQVWSLLGEFNFKCRPYWSKAELIHKMADASRINGKFWEETELAQILTFPENLHLPDTSEVDFNFRDERPSSKQQKPDLTGFGSGRDDQLQRLSSLRGISLAGLRRAQELGLLVFGVWCGLQCWGVTDRSGTVLELRRLDGKPFPAVGALSERKAHAVRGSRKRHPVGMAETEGFHYIALVEGGPDLMAAFDVILQEAVGRGEPAHCTPVAMLSANVSIEPEALPFFSGKQVRIFYHNDASGAGFKGARHWRQQIIEAGAVGCDFFHFNTITTTAVNDLNDFVIARDAGQLSPDQSALGGFCL